MQLHWDLRVVSYWHWNEGEASIFFLIFSIQRSFVAMDLAASLDGGKKRERVTNVMSLYCLMVTTNG